MSDDLQPQTPPPAPEPAAHPPPPPAPPPAPPTAENAEQYVNWVGRGANPDNVEHK